MTPVTNTTAPAVGIGPFSRSDLIVLIGALVLTVGAGVTAFVPSGQVVPFVLSAGAVALLASVVGRSVDQLGDRFGPGATGVLQSALGNLPELFIALFALRAGLVTVVQAALIGSILANLLLVLGLSFVVGGLKHGVQRLDSHRARETAVLMVLSVAAMLVPSLTALMHTPAEGHETTLSVITSVVLLVLFFVGLPGSLRRHRSSDAGARPGSSDEAVVREEAESEAEGPHWPLWLALGMLVASAAGAAFVSDWFVRALEPAMATFHISEAFAGLVIVAIAGNAVENVVGIQLAAQNRAEYAFSVIINSPLQIALVLAPLLVILSTTLGLTPLTLVFPPMLVVSVALAVLLAVFITFDGESTWMEGATLLGLYALIAASFWWG
ncbi:calcium/proton exchanger [Propioniciclava tarda]|uniref:Ca(2+)/H(+) antiporter n=1 Tax=Propioniciclava tarda TaxID=433330 RepID=A0A4Q9KQU8_PROTD|nr:calcium/proton exchanger [Propioniciclava tarda]